MLSIHWLKPSADTIVSLLDRNLTTLKYARTYFRAYGFDVKGRTKRDFIRNLYTLLNSEAADDPSEVRAGGEEQ